LRVIKKKKKKDGINLIRTSIPEEYDFKYGTGAFPSEIILTIPTTRRGIVFFRNTRGIESPCGKRRNV